MIRKIVVPVRGDGKGDNVLAHAAALAKPHKAHIQVTHCRPSAEDFMPYGVGMPAFARKALLKQTQEYAAAEEEGLREELRVLAEKLGLVVTETPTFDGATVEFVEAQGKMADVIRQCGRLADLIAVAQPDRAQNLGANTLKSALFHTGRPVMMCPPAETAPSALGAHVTIAWNGSLEASRAVAAALPILEAAASVKILCGGTPAPHGATTDDLMSYLALRQITAEVVRFDPTAGIARGLLDATKSQNADVMIMGAYGDSHEKEFLFGGNTETVIEKSDVPVIMVH